MKKMFLIIILFNFILCGEIKADVLDDYMSIIKNPNISETEKKSLRILKKWKEGKRVNPITLGSNGEIEIIYGIAQPQIMCAVLQITDIQLEPNEIATSVHIGDSARWNIEPIIAASPAGNITHLIIKPKDANLLTSLIIITNKRTYHLQLKSHKSQYFPLVKFSYPQDIVDKLNKLNKRTRNDYNIKTGNTSDYLSTLSFGYELKGNAKFKPVRVYNDGLKTIIEMPKNIQSSNIPTLMIIEEDSKDPLIVNYRYQNNRYIVDAIFDKAILISGVGWHQKKITIIRK